MDFYVNTKSDLKNNHMIGEKMGLHIYQGQIHGEKCRAKDTHNFSLKECEMAQFLFNNGMYRNASSVGWYERLCKIIQRKPLA